MIKNRNSVYSFLVFKKLPNYCRNISNYKDHTLIFRFEYNINHNFQLYYNVPGDISNRIVNPAEYNKGHLALQRIIQ